MNYSLLFADLSVYQPHFDAQHYKDAGHVLVAIKATEGTSYVNPDHHSYCLRAGVDHVAVAHYHFARPDLGTNPRQEADHFLRNALRLAGGRDYLVLDLERSVPSGFNRDPAWSREFDAYVQEKSRFHTVLYSSRSWLQESDGWLVGDKKRVWDADWSEARDYAPPGYTVWGRQTSGDGIGPEPHSLSGVGACDVNRMSRTTYNVVTNHLP